MPFDQHGHFNNTPFKKLVAIKNAIHVLHLEKQRIQLYDEVFDFLLENTEVQISNAEKL
ncbi:MAG: hypothetical protein JKY57_02420 [Kordiimonadaceae bacterium]|nr:hypothetical protein [Kordiimonadaceae bacterium]